MKLKELTDFLEQFAPLALQEDYDNSGLIVGNTDIKISSALVCLDSTEQVIDEAVNRKCNLIIAHHPVVFTGIKKLTGSNYIQRALLKAIKNDIAVYSIHTNLDNMHNGVNAKLCERLELSNCRVLSPKKKRLRKLFTFCPVDKADKVRRALFDAGAGHIGNYDQCSFNVEGFGTFRGLEGTNPYVGQKGKLHREKEIKIETIFPAYLENKIVQALLASHPYQEAAYDILSLENFAPHIGSGMIGELKQPLDEKVFLKRVKEKLLVPCIRHTKLQGKKVKKIAVCGGSGSFLLGEAISADADVFVTSDFKYHQFFDADNNVVIADIGHYEGEQFTKELVVELINKKFPTFAVLLSETNSNPVNYFY